MTGRLTLFVLFIGIVLVACSRFPLRRYDFVNILMTWSEARLYCRQNHSDLATFEYMEEVQQLQPDFNYTWAWIGLHDDPSAWQGVMGNESNSWRWSSTGQTNRGGFQKWEWRDPKYRNHEETCVWMDPDGMWQDKSCSQRLGSLCFTESDSGQRSYLYINSSKSWAEAQAYCRQHHTDLAIIESSEQNSDAFNAKPDRAAAWVGLYREPWAWSDHSLSSFRYWIQGNPDETETQQCVTERNGDHMWDTEYCYAEHAAWCQTVQKLQTSVQVTMKTTADLTQPLTNAQILQKVEAALKSRGYTDVKLTWRMQKLKKTEHSPAPKCDNF